MLTISLHHTDASQPQPAIAPTKPYLAAKSLNQRHFLSTTNLHHHLPQQSQVKLPYKLSYSSYPQASNLLVQTNGLPINPRNFLIILTPTKKKN